MAKAKCKNCEDKCGMSKIRPEVLLVLERQFKEFLETPSNSLLKKYLTEKVFDDIKNLKTSYKATLLDCVQSGFQNPDSQVGIYASDPDAYTVFETLFDPIIEEYHFGFKKRDKHPPSNFGDVNTIHNIDPKNEFVISTRIRCRRTVKGFPFGPLLTEEDYKILEDTIVSQLQNLTGELRGEYYSLKDMSQEFKSDLLENNFLFKESDRFLQAANAFRYWPTGRGVFFNCKKTFLVWIGQEDHMSIISMQSGGNLGDVYKRFVKGVTAVESKIDCLKHDRLGYYTFCPTNLGTGFRAVVLLKLPHLTENFKKLNELADKYQLKIRGTHLEHTESPDGVYYIFNKCPLGLTEYDAIKQVQEGVLEMIKNERASALEAKRMKPPAEDIEDET